MWIFRRERKCSWMIVGQERQRPTIVGEVVEGRNAFVPEVLGACAVVVEIVDVDLVVAL